MDGIFTALQDSLAENEKAMSNPSPSGAISHADLYRSRTSNSDQESRRTDFLRNQKDKRWDIMKMMRNLTEDDELEEEEESAEPGAEMHPQSGMDAQEETAAAEEAMERPNRKRNWEKHREKAKRYYNDHLMQSEWMYDVPEDLEEEWLTVLCPEGHRRLVVAYHGVTNVFNKAGFKDVRFPRKGFRSKLPGGNRGTHGKGYTVLDCIYVEKEMTFYVLDLMAWNTQTLYECETEFRFFWLNQRLSECPQVRVLGGKANPYRFLPLQSFRFSPEDLQNAMDASPFLVDGVLFFHQRSHYTLGDTPLVLWLKPFMLPEVFGLTVQEAYKEKQPAVYPGYRAYIESGCWRNLGKGKRKKKGQSEASMDVVESSGSGALSPPDSGAQPHFQFSPAKLPGGFAFGPDGADGGSPFS